MTPFSAARFLLYNPFVQVQRVPSLVANFSGFSRGFKTLISITIPKSSSCIVLSSKPSASLSFPLFSSTAIRQLSKTTEGTPSLLTPISTKLTTGGNLNNIYKSSTTIGQYFTILRHATQTVSTKKRTKRKAGSKVIMDEFGVRGYDQQHDNEMTYPVVAYATCDELNLEKLRHGLLEQGLYVPTVWDEDLSMEDVVHATAKYSIGDEPREIFFFREGAVVFWNIPDLERFNVLKFMEPYQEESYKNSDILQESEYMLYANQETGSTRLSNKGKIIISSEDENHPNLALVKYTFSNAMALSVKLGIWESSLETFVENIEHLSDELKRGKKVKLTRAQVLQKSGELFSLRHQLNLNSDLLDTPDFYWERENLETLYQKTFNYLSINRRTNVMNEKLNQCCELLDLILSHLNDNHHIRLEWLIIILIMIEVMFECLHFAERYL